MMPQDTAHRPTVYPLGDLANTIAQPTPTPRSSGENNDRRGLLVGHGIGPYELLQRIGRGGLGDVYRARHTITGDVVALKLLRGGDEPTPAEMRSFRREIDVARRLDHPGILRILDAGYRDGLPYFTMPLIEGGSLERHLRGAGSLDLRAGITLLMRVARAVQAAHAQGVIHRDLKPANILIGDHGQPLVADFGLARFLDQNSVHTISGQVMGSLPYMSPEQAAGHSHRSGPTTDIWPLGVMLYELLTGEKPFRGESQTAVLHHIQHDDPPPPSQVRGDVPADLERVCLVCLRKDPRDRFASAGELADDLQRWLNGEPVCASLAPRRVRRLRAWPALVAGAAMLFIATCILSSLAVNAGGTDKPTSAKQGPTPDAATMEKLRRHLARAAPGQPVELMSSKQKPLWARFVVGEGYAKFLHRRGEKPWITMPDRALLELLPADPQRGPYRLMITLVFDGFGAFSRVGIYAGQTMTQVGVNRVHTFAEVVFPESGGGELSAALNYAAFIEFPNGEVSSQRTQTGFRLALLAPVNPVRPPRRYGMDVEVGRVGIGLPGQLAAWPPAIRHTIALDQLRGNQEVNGAQPVFSPTAPAGIVLWDARVKIHRITYEPLTASR